MEESYWGRVAEFYGNAGYGMVTIVLPTLAVAILLAACFAGLVKLSRARIGFLLSFCFLLAFALVGSVSGVIAGSTLEAIVGAVLAAVLGLVSSMLAYLFGKDTLRAWRPVIPLAIGALLISTLVGLMLGGSRRNQVLQMNDDRASAEARYQKVTLPLELQRNSALLKRCLDESKDLEQAMGCNVGGE